MKKRLQTQCYFALALSIFVLATLTMSCLNRRGLNEHFNICIARPQSLTRAPSGNPDSGNNERMRPRDKGRGRGDDNPYRGYFNQVFRIAIVGRASYHYLSQDNTRETLYFWGADEAAIDFVMKPATETDITRRVRVGDKVVFMDQGTGQFLYARPSDRKLILSPLSTPFTIKNKYSGCEGYEYEDNINNRNRNCDFPYYDCFARCARRTLVTDDGMKITRSPGDSEDRKYDAYVGNSGSWETWTLILMSW